MSSPDTTAPLIVGIGGSVSGATAADRALSFALRMAAADGMRVLQFVGPSIVLPMYLAGAEHRTAEAGALIAALRQAHGVILASPAYHGSLSGSLKNVLDYVEDMRSDPEIYLEGRAVGLIAAAPGWRGAGTALSAMRSIVHALRGWPTPMGIAINEREVQFSGDGTPRDEGIATQLQIMSSQVVAFARLRHRPGRDIRDVAA